jgi:hypothetical protein
MLCRLLHCLPSQLRAERVEDVIALMTCLGVKHEMDEQKNTSGLDPSMRGTGRGSTN